MARETVEVPIAGKIVSVDVKAGDAVKEGDVLCVLESMKMEIRVKSPRSGRVAEIRVREGDSILEDDVVAIVE